jgi:DNA-binding transcriptional LysR family regulator
MEIESRPLRCFVTVADTRSFTKAAELLHITQPTLSTQIRELEKYLGFALFARTTRSVDLTKDGEAFLPHARRMIEESGRIKDAIRTLRVESERQLKIGAAFYTIDIPERVQMIEDFMSAHPEILLDIDNRWQRELLEDLTRGKIDLAFIIGVRIPRRDFDAVETRQNNSEVLYPDDLDEIVLRREPVGLLIPAESPLAARKSIRPSDLAGMKIAMLSPAHGAQVYNPIADLLQRAGARLVVPPEGNGIGVERYGRQFRVPAVTLGWFAEHSKGPVDMVRLPLHGLELETALVVLSARDNMRSPIRLFRDLAAGRKTAPRRKRSASARGSSARRAP